jgi:hypothetical protein
VLLQLSASINIKTPITHPLSPSNLVGTVSTVFSIAILLWDSESSNCPTWRRTKKTTFCPRTPRAISSPSPSTRWKSTRRWVSCKRLWWDLYVLPLLPHYGPWQKPEELVVAPELVWASAAKFRRDLWSVYLIVIGAKAACDSIFACVRAVNLLYPPGWLIPMGTLSLLDWPLVLVTSGHSARNRSCYCSLILSGRPTSQPHRSLNRSLAPRYALSFLLTLRTASLQSFSTDFQPFTFDAIWALRISPQPPQ